LCHRNISLDTILLNGNRCQISGLDCSLRIPREKPDQWNLLQPQPIQGTNIQYAAPELFASEPFDGYAIDLWSAGIILFVLLFGAETLFAAPFVEDPKFQQICVDVNLRQIIKQQYGQEQQLKKQKPSSGSSTISSDQENKTINPISSSSSSSPLLVVSNEVMDLLQNMLRANPSDRLDLNQVKSHPWVINNKQ